MGGANKRIHLLLISSTGRTVSVLLANADNLFSKKGDKGDKQIWATISVIYSVVNTIMSGIALVHGEKTGEPWSREI